MSNIAGFKSEELLFFSVSYDSEWKDFGFWAVFSTLFDIS